MRRDRIYPVPIKPRSGITTWSGWPDDVRPILRAWNASNSRCRQLGYPVHSLSFRQSQTGSIFQPQVDVFKCVDCEEFCEPAASGAAVLDGDWLCDDCLIGRARAVVRQAPIPEEDP